MKITMNGKEMEMQTSLTVSELLEVENIDSPEMVSVELNEEILAKEAFSTTHIQDNDTIEFLYFMGGGTQEYERYRPKI